MKRSCDLLLALAEPLGLAAPQPGNLGRRPVTGRLGSAGARLTVRSHGAARWLVVHLAGPLRAGPLCFEPSRPCPRARRRTRTLTGDLWFDARILTYGAPPLVAAMMNDGTRAWVLDLVGDGDGLWIGPRRLLYRVRLDDADGEDVGDLVRRVRRLAGGWRRWDLPADLRLRWAANALRDRDRRVRALNARRYLHRAGSGTADAAALASLAGCRRLPSGLREEAVFLLARDGAGVDALAGLLDTQDPAVFRNVVSLLVDRHPDPVPHLVAALSRAEGRAAMRCAEALAVLEDPRAVPGLIGLIARPDERVQAAAFDALGRTGTPAIAPLLATEAGRRTAGLAQTSAVRALRALRMRFPSEEAWRARGALSLTAATDDPAGRQGALSLPSDP